jgi:hypothetical protein
MDLGNVRSKKVAAFRDVRPSVREGRAMPCALYAVLRSLGWRLRGKTRCPERKQRLGICCSWGARRCGAARGLPSLPVFAAITTGLQAGAGQ